VTAPTPDANCHVDTAARSRLQPGVELDALELTGSGIALLPPRLSFYQIRATMNPGAG